MKVLSAAAVALHAEALRATILAGHFGHLSFEEVASLAATRESLIDELVDAGMWDRGLRVFYVNAGPLAFMCTAELIRTPPECEPPPGPSPAHDLESLPTGPAESRPSAMSSVDGYDRLDLALLLERIDAVDAPQAARRSGRTGSADVDATPTEPAVCAELKGFCEEDGSTPIRRN